MKQLQAIESACDLVIAEFAPAEVPLLGDVIEDHLANPSLDLGAVDRTTTRNAAGPGTEAIVLSTFVVPIVVSLLTEVGKYGLAWVVDQLRGQSKGKISQDDAQKLAKAIVDAVGQSTHVS